MFIKANKNILVKGEPVQAGDIIETDAATGRYLVEGNFATAAEKPAPPKKKTSRKKTTPAKKAEQ